MGERIAALTRRPRTLGEAVGYVVGERRRELGMSVVMLALLTRTSTTTIYSFQQGKHSPSLTTLEEYARALRVNVSDLLARAERLLETQSEAAE